MTEKETAKADQLNKNTDNTNVDFVLKQYIVTDGSTKKHIEPNFKETLSPQYINATAIAGNVFQNKQAGNPMEIKSEIKLPGLSPNLEQTIKFNIIFKNLAINTNEILVDYEAIEPTKIETFAIYDTAFFQTKRYYVIKIQNQKFVLTNSWFEPGTLVHSWFGPDGYTYQFDLENILSQDIQKFRKFEKSTIRIWKPSAKEYVNLQITPMISSDSFQYLQISEVQTTAIHKQSL